MLMLDDLALMILDLELAELTRGRICGRMLRENEDDCFIFCLLSATYPDSFDTLALILDQSKYEAKIWLLPMIVQASWLNR